MNRKEYSWGVPYHHVIQPSHGGNRSRDSPQKYVSMDESHLGSLSRDPVVWPLQDETRDVSVTGGREGDGVGQTPGYRWSSRIRPTGFRSCLWVRPVNSIFSPGWGLGAPTVYNVHKFTGTFTRAPNLPDDVGDTPTGWGWGVRDRTTPTPGANLKSRISCFVRDVVRGGLTIKWRSSEQTLQLKQRNSR